MQLSIKKLNSFAKDFILFSRIALLFKPFSNFLKFLSNLSLLTSWINNKGKEAAFSDFYKPVRNYDNRIKLREYLMDTQGLANKPIHFFEFGVASGNSFMWWVDNNRDKDAAFYGFDTFEGLPEDWAFFKKGDLSFGVPAIDDARVSFYKGLFQDTFYNFLEDYRTKHGVKSNITKVIHMDADLYSSTLFALTMLAPYLRAGDIIIFDEFNVPNHEFAAWNDFIRSYYLKYKVLGSVNNFYQTAFQLQ